MNDHAEKHRRIAKGLRAQADKILAEAKGHAEYLRKRADEEDQRAVEESKKVG